MEKRVRLIFEATGHSQPVAIEIDNFIRQRCGSKSLLSIHEYKMHAIDIAMERFGGVVSTERISENDYHYIRNKVGDDICHIYNLLVAKKKLRPLQPRDYETESDFVKRKGRAVLSIF